ncbi:hypothetical protein [uncultured Lutibacter sp.]|uniref:hypothetical protein n=1 Tax=uncultured Lutibacter sp. TaxID=437739 RepID=UPI00260D11ED|nr:hypothetical protein [uncultured Lutibacter sp.]
MRNSFILILLAFSLTNCNSSIKKSKITELKVVDLSEKEVEGLLLLQQKCYPCHSVIAETHDNIIAPPMEAIKRRYKISYKTKVEFVDAVTIWVIDPKEENALMRGAVNQFKVMPKQAFIKEDIIKIAGYIYDNELEKPIWFESHFNDEHPNGIGNGQGRGMGKKS